MRLTDTRQLDPLESLPSWSMTLGAVVAALGLLALAAPWVASTVVAVVCGGALVAAGVSQLGMTAVTWTWRGFWLTLLCGVLSIVAGVAMVVIPVEGIHALVTFLGILILFEAAAKFTAAYSAPPGFPWGWLLFDGIVTTILGGILLTAPASQAGIYLGVLIGINLLSSGVSFLATGIWLRRSIG